VRALLVLASLVFASFVSTLGCAGAPPQQAGADGGERLYRSKCAGCHRAYPPASRGADAWSEVLSRMAPKAKLSDEERARVLEYLRSNAKDAAGGRP
jgi:mono/diheme cytochrome c family protein